MAARESARSILFVAQRDLDQFGELLLGEWRVDEFELDRIPLYALDVLHLVGLHRLLRVKLLDRAFDQTPVELHLVRIHLDRLGIRVHPVDRLDRKSTRLNSSHRTISYAVFCLKKKK